jgi:hypothetical protein
MVILALHFSKQISTKKFSFMSNINVKRANPMAGRTENIPNVLYLHYDCANLLGDIHDATCTLGSLLLLMVLMRSALRDSS